MPAYKTVKINPALPNRPRASVLVIYTGGTLGMVFEKGNLVPFDFEQILDKLPEIKRLDFEITFTSLEEIMDSSNMRPEVWAEIANLIQRNYAFYDSFVILHGTDTMAYTASALSFMLQNLHKPVILTGAQLPIGVARTDARENIITALEIAAAQTDGQPLVPEVCIYFQNYLLRGNRAKKKESSQFNAFRSENYPALAEVGVTIEYNRPYIASYRTDAPFGVQAQLDANVAILKLFPGMTQNVVRSVLSISGLRGVVLETFGAGNAPTLPWFLHELKEATERGIIILNVSQCDGGRVMQGRYQTSSWFDKIGVVSGGDITTEAAITKMMWILGQETDHNLIRQRLSQPLAGEMSL
ncbi:asparaginase [Runella zeae]|uniref:asparaginase n=1 Tax=Runella zeae TaxID=94255 RepID=UPI00041E8A27|nr:asparaginase [Runella zeae]